MRMPTVPGRRRGFRAGFPEASRAFPTGRAARGHRHPPRPAPRVTSRRALTSRGNGGAQERTRGAAAVAAGRALFPSVPSVPLRSSLSLSVPWLLSAVSAGRGTAGGAGARSSRAWRRRPCPVFPGWAGAGARRGLCGFILDSTFISTSVPGGMQ